MISQASAFAAVLAAVLTVGGAGCAGRAAHLRAENGQLRDELAALRADSHRTRQKARDLENKLFLLEDRLETARVERDRARGLEVVLPVEVRAPEVDSEAGYGDDLDDDHEPVEIAGESTDGTEIVYAGEARRNRSVAPRYRPTPRGYPADVADGGPGGAPPAVRPRPAPIPAEHGRLPVTRTTGPTVDEQIRRAAARSRGRAAVPAASAVPVAPAVKDPTPEARVVSTPGRDGAGHADSDGNGAGPAARAGATRPTTETPQAEYRRLYAALREGHHETAIAGFRRFLRRHPRHDYADNAQYWLGEAYYDQRDYSTALVEFRRVVTDHPRGNKVPDALLKIGYCYVALGEPAKARQVLTQVAEIYPKSNPASLARERLATLSQDGAP